MAPDQPRQPHPESSRTRHRPVLRTLLPIIVVICAVALAFWLIKTGPKAKPRVKERNAVMVDVRPVAFGRQETTVQVMGTVVPKRQVVLKPQVEGQVIGISPKMIPGGRFAKGEQLFEIDPSDYRLAVQQLASEVARAEADLQIELGRQRVAEKEYQLLGSEVSPEEKALMLREPQRDNLRAILAGARARLEQARLDLERTVIRAPFNAVVIARAVDLGASVSPGTELATLVDSDSYWIEAPVPSSQLQWIDTGRHGETGGSPARVFDSVAWGAARFRPGQVIGMTATVEEQGRMAGLLVEIPDPLALKNNTADRPELLLGRYVRLEIQGAALPHAAVIDRDLVRDGDRVWIMDAQDKLDIRPIEIAFRGQDNVLVTGGIVDGELLVTSNLPSPVQGMSLRPREVTNSSSAAEPARP